MACYHPNIRCVYGYHSNWDGSPVLTQKGKPKEAFKMYSLEEFEVRCAVDPDFPKLFERIDRVPCGRCIGCRLDYSRKWATRCVMEQMTSPKDSCFFLTLTYSPENLPTSKLYSKTGEIVDNPSGVLDYDRLHKFTKDLNEYYQYHYGHGVRYYAAGEYGDDKGRPHFHLITFNQEMNDLTINPRSRKGFPLYSSKLLEKLWPDGIVRIGEANFQTMAYTARYVMKKRKGKDSIAEYSERCLIPEETRMSRRPGIASDFIKSHKDDFINNLAVEIGQKFPVSPPRMFYTMYEDEMPETIVDIKHRIREKAEWSSAAEFAKNDYATESEYLARKEMTKCINARQLIRQYDKFNK